MNHIRVMFLLLGFGLWSFAWIAQSQENGLGPGAAAPESGPYEAAGPQGGAPGPGLYEAPAPQGGAPAQAAPSSLVEAEAPATPPPAANEVVATDTSPAPVVEGEEAPVTPSLAVTPDAAPVPVVQAESEAPAVVTAPETPAVTAESKPSQSDAPAEVFEIDRTISSDSGAAPAQPEAVKAVTEPEASHPAETKKPRLWQRMFGSGVAPTEPAPVSVTDAPAADAPPAADVTAVVASEPLTPEALMAAREEVRRQALEHEGLQNFDQGQEAMMRGEFEAALKFYNKALELMPKRPHTVEIRNQARMNQAECEYRMALNFYREDNLTEARNALRRALGYYPSHAKAMRMMDRIREDEIKRQAAAARPLHVRKTPEYQAQAKDIQKALERGNQYMSVNDFEKAHEEFQSVLQAEPLNSDAAAHLKRLADRRYRKETEQMNRFQSEMITQVRDTWTPPVKRMVAQRSEVETGVGTVRPGTRRLLEKLNSIIIPQLDFRAANIHDVITYIDLQAQAADKDSPPNERGVNIVLNLQRPGSAVTTAAPAQEVDPFAMTAEPAGAAAAAGVPTVTLALRNVYLLDAIKFITEMTGLKYRIENDVLVITPVDVVVGDVITRTYKIQPGVISEHIFSAAPASSGGGGLFDLGGPATGGQTSGGSGDIKQFFVEAGVPFPEGTAIVYKPSLNLMIVSNTSENLEKFERILNMLNVVPIQVEIEARFVEVQQTDLEELGIEWLLNDNWIIAQNAGQKALPPSARERIQMNKNDMTKGLRYMGGVGDTVIATPSGTSGGILSISSVLTGPQVTMILHALEQRSGSNLLSAPKVTTRTGSNAEIKVVRELIYPTDYEITPAQTLGTTGAQSFSPAFVTPTGFEERDLGVVLNVTPTVGPDNYTIDLIMMPQVTELYEWINYGSKMSDGRGGLVDMDLHQPIFHSRTITTSISIWDGQTVVMGGLITEAQETTEDKVPFLGDIPLLGNLFRSKTDHSVKRNLLIFVTANLVDPAGNKINKDNGVGAPAAPGGATGAAASTMAAATP